MQTKAFRLAILGAHPAAAGLWGGLSVAGLGVSAVLVVGTAWLPYAPVWIALILTALAIVREHYFGVRGLGIKQVAPVWGIDVPEIRYARALP